VTIVTVGDDDGKPQKIRLDPGRTYGGLARGDPTGPLRNVSSSQLVARANLVNSEVAARIARGGDPVPMRNGEAFPPAGDLLKSLPDGQLLARGELLNDALASRRDELLAVRTAASAMAAASSKKATAALSVSTGASAAVAPRLRVNPQSSPKKIAALAAAAASAAAAPPSRVAFMTIVPASRKVGSAQSHVHSSAAAIHQVYFHYSCTYFLNYCCMRFRIVFGACGILPEETRGLNSRCRGRLTAAHPRAQPPQAEGGSFVAIVAIVAVVVVSNTFRPGKIVQSKNEVGWSNQESWRAHQRSAELENC